jgi:hypothetical protein
MQTLKQKQNKTKKVTIQKQNRIGGIGAGWVEEEKKWGDVVKGYKVAVT